MSNLSTSVGPDDRFPAEVTAAGVAIADVIAVAVISAGVRTLGAMFVGVITVGVSSVDLVVCTERDTTFDLCLFVEDPAAASLPLTWSVFD